MNSLPYSLHAGKMEDVVPTFKENTFHSCVTDPPYGIRFMGKAWDKFDIERVAKFRGVKYDALDYNHNSMAAGKYDRSGDANRQFQTWTTMWAEHVYRVLRPGAYLVVFASPRTYHRMAAGVEDAGFEIRDQIFWVFASGFPKSHNLSGDFAGYGTALKPAHEPILVARKPLDGTVKENMVKWGTGAINIKDSLVQGGGPWLYGNQPKLNGARYQPGQITPLERHAENIEGGQDGRWPANLIHDGSSEVVDLFPEASGANCGGGPEFGDKKSINTYNDYGPRRVMEPRNDSGSASRFFQACDDSEDLVRFFYCGKTSRTDRNEGCDSFEDRPLLWSSGTKNPGSFQAEGTKKSSPNNHPTVKPTTLMRYLVKLFTAKGGHVLDPFNGSGSTGKAAMFEHFDYTGIDMDEHNIMISKARIEYALRHRSNQIALFS